MKFSASELAKSMIAAARPGLQKHWKEARAFAEAEFRKLAQTLVLIAKLTASGAITQARARLHLEMQRNAARVVLLTIEGIGLIAAQTAINAALQAVGVTVNRAVGFTLI